MSTKYQNNFPELAKKYAESGLNDSEIATSLGISSKSLYNYRQKYPELAKALKEGKAPADLAIENALFKMATGFQLVEEKILTAPDGSVTRQTTIKDQKPSVAALRFWLVNRCPERWQHISKLEKEKVTEHLFQANKILEELPNIERKEFLDKLIESE